MQADPAAGAIAISIVSYGTSRMVLAALPALLAELDRFGRAAVLIVDNASPGGDGDALEAGVAALGDPRVQVIRSARNGGFSAGNNLAFAAAERLEFVPEAIMLLNPDAEVRPGAVVRLWEELARDPAIAVAGACLENPDGSTSSSAFAFPDIRNEFSRGTCLGLFMNRWPIDAEARPGPSDVDWVTGAAMLVRREAIAEVGGMDERYFLYFEEVDFMLQMRRAGWRIVHVPDARVLHDAGGATGIIGGLPKAGRMPDYWFDSWARYFEKNHGRGYRVAAAAARLGGSWLGLAQLTLRGRRYSSSPGFASTFLRRCLLGFGRKGAA